MNVTLRQLRVFIEVARLHSFSRAGDEIGLTQSAVSRCVRELEAEMGVKLVDRTTREVQLTDVGANLIASIPRLIGDLDDALREIREIGEQRRGRVVVAASPTVACRLMPEVVAACGRRFPYVTLGLRDDVQSDVVRKVRSGEVDFGVIIGPLGAQPVADDLETELLTTDSFCVVVRDDHALAQRDAVSWQALDGERLVMLDHASGSRPLIDAVMREQGVHARVVQELGHPATVFGLVEAGVGVSVLPWLALPVPSGSSLVARPLVPRAERTVELVRRRERSLSPAAEAVWTLIRELDARPEASRGAG
ncbi:MULTISPECIES: LysR family transcriptional regulator [Paraburkholderia]|uniref:LysR family transcriptional regulator n=1 Tax=Paraburkholderia tropica TaxID=92647 RepID=A0A1A5XA48_9BURK|nr:MULTISPECIES: LysR family transcriptional regulator [Paraburkholderia]MBB2982311.1 DNA-binding transcriptional LysR family regulator [Paraburkholderia tropica]MBB2999819.1 DNA-binding transcriptional LysR family regulator [Paraburkholderia tropica]MBB6319451.1 DNA-binding transcriptional LysR family regulator [Paraburkholderia tropica]MDE1142776.1 LysR family transcriptional regulator [Paraburkholderia tropica]OBR50386.1 LysR family transcriptional regulator [Paraburkholderia tropica]